VKADRPFGLAVVTVWTAVQGFLTAIVGFAFVVAVLVAEAATEDLSDALDQDVSPSTGEAVGAAVVTLIILFVGIGLLVAALGLWALQGWGRRLGQIVYVIAAIVSVFGLLVPPYLPAETLIGLFSAVTSVSIVVYLSVPRVGAMFQRGEPTEIAMPVPVISRAAPAVVEAVAPEPQPAGQSSPGETEGTGQVFCTMCGSPNREDNTFCEACGRPLASPA